MDFGLAYCAISAKHCVLSLAVLDNLYASCQRSLLKVCKGGKALVQNRRSVKEFVMLCKVP